MLDARIRALDALRGLAVIGIVPMNVLVFAMPPQAYINPRAWNGLGGGTGPVEVAVWALVFLLIEDKFRGLFAMMFGAGVAILLGRPQRRPLRSHYARMAALFAIGLVHATLLANNDILRLYAMAGLLLPLLGEWPRDRLLRLGRWMMLVSLPPLALLAAGTIWSDFAAVPTAAGALVWSAPFDLLLAIGWAALAMALFTAREDHPLVRRLAATGRLTLINYLATSLIFAAIFTSWGLGLFGEIDRVEALAICAAPVTFMLLFAPWWLARFRQGPLEWLWRSVAGGKMHALRR